MKKLILLSTICCGALIGNAQKTLPAGNKIQAMPKTIKTVSIAQNSSLYSKFKPVVSPTRQAAFAGTFTPAVIVRNIGGVNVRSVPVINGTSNDNISTNPTPNSVQKSTEGMFECTTSRETVTADSKSFMSVTANGDGIYPGAIYTFSDFMNGNFLKEVGVGKRNPIQVFTNNLANSTGAVAVTVNNPNAPNIFSAIANLVRNNSTSNVSATQIGQYIYSQNQAGLVMSLSGGGAYSGFSANAGFTLNKKQNRIYITCDFKIPLYTLYTNFPENGFLNDANLERTPNLVVLNSVTYGTRVLVNIEIEEDSLKGDITAKFKYGDPDKAGFNVDLKFLMENKNIKNIVNTYVVGANPQNLGSPRTVDQIYAFVDACIRNTNYQTAKPISYTMSTMAGELIGIKSATDEYVVKNCVPKDVVTYVSGATVSIFTKGNYKESGSNAKLTLSAVNGTRLIVQAPQNNAQMGPDKSFPIGFYITNPFPTKDLKLGKNYLDIHLDKPNCVFSCDDWEISSVILTLNISDDRGTILESKTINLCNTSFVLNKDNTLRLEFDGNFNPLSQNLL